MTRTHSELRSLRSRLVGLAMVSAIAGALTGALLTPFSVMAQTVTMWTFLNPKNETPRDRALRQIIEKFEASNPGIKIKVESQVWFTLAEKFVMAHRSRSAPDIGWVNGENMGLLVNSGVAEDLGPLITAKWSEAMKRDLVLPQAYEWVRPGGKQIAVPIMALSIVLFYRNDLMREAGIDPAGIKTWDDLAAAAAKMQRANGPNVERWGVGMHLSTDKTTMSFGANALAGAQGGQLFGDKCKALLANENGVRALNMQADLIRKHKVASQESFAHTLDDVIEQFIAGKVAIASSGNGRFGNVVEKATWNGKELGMLPWPSLDGKKPGPQIMSGWFASISKGSKQKEAAAKFVAYMTGPDGMEMWAEPGGQVPLFKSIFDKPSFKDAKYDPLRQLSRMWADAEVWLPAECNAARTFVDLNTATQRVVLGNIDPMTALREAEAASASRQ